MVLDKGNTFEECQRSEPDILNHIEISPQIAEDDKKLYNSTENLRDGVNESVDEAQMIQTTDYYLHYRSKFNAAQKKDLTPGTRQQMMPLQTSQPGIELNRQLSTPNPHSKESDLSSQG